MGNKQNNSLFCVVLKSGSIKCTDIGEVEEILWKSEELSRGLHFKIVGVFK